MEVEILFLAALVGQLFHKDSHEILKLKIKPFFFY